MERMPATRLVLLAAASLLAACGDRSPQPTASTYRLAAQVTFDVPQAELEAAMDRTMQANLPPVFVAYRAFGRARDVVRTVSARGWPTVLTVTEPNAGSANTALVVAPHGADVAVDLALLACHGIELPPRIGLGAMVVAPDDTVTRQPAPGDFAVATLRRQYADLLTQAPSTDVVFRIGLLLWGTNEIEPVPPKRVREAVERYPQLDLVEKAADSDAVRFATSGRELLAGGCRVLLVTADDAAVLEPLAAAAAEYKAALIRIGDAIGHADATCSVAVDPEALGRATGEAVRLLAPGGAAILEAAMRFDDEAAERRSRALAQSLGLAKKQ
jgi:hypothetical protein